MAPRVEVPTRKDILGVQYLEQGIAGQAADLFIHLYDNVLKIAALGLVILDHRDAGQSSQS